jgi:hypothetical protein
MVGLNANTGKIDPGFGKEGEVDLEVAYAGAPTIYKNLILLGTNFYGPGERHINPALDQAGGSAATRTPMTLERASNYGSSTPYLGRVRWATTPGETTVGKIAPATTSGRSL